MPKNEVIEIFKCKRCGRQWKTKKKARKCRHGAQTIEDLTKYSVGTKFLTQNDLIIEITGKIQFPVKGIMQAYYLLNWGNRKSRLMQKTIDEYLHNDLWEIM